MQIVRPIQHDAVVHGLWRAAANERLSHALCFVGPRGVGGFVAALWFANGLLCERGIPTGEDAAPCGVCGGCKKLASGGWRGNHPDLMRIDPVEYLNPEGEHESSLSIHWVRERPNGRDSRKDPPDTIEGFLTLRPVEGERRVVIVREAERLGNEAQNALLKTLEEPPDGTTLVLQTSRIEALLPTVRSRVVRVPLAPLERTASRAVIDRLGEEGAIAAGVDVDALAALAEGAPGLAVEAAREGLVPLRGHLVDVLTGRTRAYAALEAIWKVEGEYRARTQRMRDGERVRVAARLAGGLLLDAQRVAEGVAPARHPDLEARLRDELLPRWSPTAGAAALDEVARVTGDLGLQMDPHGAMERLVRAVGDAARGGASALAPR